jgi:hypothetical protein
MASSPYVKTELRMVQRRRADRDGGWLGLRRVCGHFGTMAAADREQDGTEGLGARLI